MRRGLENNWLVGPAIRWGFNRLGPACILQAKTRLFWRKPFRHAVSILVFFFVPPLDPGEYIESLLPG